MRRVVALLAVAASCLGCCLLTLAFLGGDGAAVRASSGDSAQRTEVVVVLESPSLARGPDAAAQLDAEQRAFRRLLDRELPAAELRWRYRLVLNGFAVDLPRADLERLRGLPGVRDVYGSARYGTTLDRSPGHIGASALWGPGLETAGQGMKIGIIDTGLDQRHPFFDPTGYAMPPGFPKGQTRFTTAKVIVARAFPPKGVTSRAARAPFDSDQSSHGTHVAGIAAGNARTKASDGRIVSGIAPRAYIGNYKALTRTAFGLSPNGNAPEIVAAIEAAVADGMNVINLSIGQPEIEPTRDVVALALNAAAAAGVVPVVAAGNDFSSLGAGSVSSPANAASAITVAAVEMQGASADVHADFSSVGPTPISLLLKPDVAAPGVAILSSLPDGAWGSLSGTSMAAPHVAGAAALLKQRHPSWTVAELKSALVQTGADAVRGSTALGPQFQGGGSIALARADVPLLFASPAAVSFGLLQGRGFATQGSIELRDAGGGAGVWELSVQQLRAPSGASVAIGTSQVSVPGELAYEIRVTDSAREGDISGYLALRRAGDLRRIPFWGRVTAPGLSRHRPVALPTPGVRNGTTQGKPALVSRYRYPENPSGLGVTTVLAGPEAVYRVLVSKRIANFGVVVTRQGTGSSIEPRVVRGLDANRLTGYAGLPVDHNPYLSSFRESVLAAGALSPAPGEYAVVFDSGTRAGAGAFTFRFWTNDVTPPTARLRATSVRQGKPFVVAVRDVGSGVYPESLRVSLDGREVDATVRGGLVRVASGRLEPGRHRLRLRISDYQEAKNTENVAGILPNTRTLVASITIRPA
jgi:subtilisin family serine protease